jgi:hypothetical protein
MDIIDLTLSLLKYAPIFFLGVAAAFLFYLQVREARMEKAQRYRRRY